MYVTQEDLRLQELNSSIEEMKVWNDRAMEW